MSKDELRPVVTYKSLNGTYYESAEECLRHNRIYRDEQNAAKITDYLCKLLTLSPNQQSWSNGSERVWSDKMHIVAIVKANWKALRDVMNSIEE